MRFWGCAFIPNAFFFDLNHCYTLYALHNIRTESVENCVHNVTVSPKNLGKKINLYAVQDKILSVPQTSTQQKYTLLHAITQQ